ncbi:hypothetical protein [Micromonospora haikouensis]|uniref:hypothetical protein n=1 Tax=Micromonospora haikouensis TaxID=686309 RepID=UPI003D8AE0C5
MTLRGGWFAMRVRIDSRTRRGLRIIEEIPDNPLGKIEGYNGIGKTNAIKLLRLCAGEQPFQDEASWQSFRDHLIGAKVRISGLLDARRIEWELDPSRWPPSLEPPGDRLGTVKVDGALASHLAIPPLLRVHHILAAESPLDVLKERIESARRSVVGWARSSGEPRQRLIDVKLGDTLKLLLNSQPAQLQLDIKADQEAKRLAQDAADHLAQLKERADLLEQAVDASEKLGEVRGRGSEMDSKLQELEKNITSIDSSRADLDRKIAELSERRHSNNQAERDFVNAQKFVVTKGKALREVTTHFESLMAAAEITANEAELSSERVALGMLLQSLVDRLPQVNAIPMLIATLEGVADRLVEAEAHDLGAATLIESTEVRQAWTVYELRQACLQQIETLSRTTPSAEAQELTTRIKETRARIGALARAEATLVQLEKARLDFERAEGRLRNAAKALPAKAAQTIDGLIEERNRLDSQGRIMQAEHARLSHAREILGGGMTEETLAAKLLQLSRAAGVDPARIRGRLEQTRAQLDAATRDHALATQKSDRAARALSEHVARVSRAVDELAQEPQYEWLRQADPAVNSFRSLSITEQAAAIERLQARIENARSDLAVAVREVQALGKSFDGLHNWLSRRKDPDAGLEEFDVATRVWLANEVRSWFQDPMISEALFEGATNVRLDWQDLTVHWRTNGEPRNRPLINFSSGEQTFAYTHAQLAQLERADDGVANRLIALDEFGSFLDAKRMQNLVEYLEKRVMRVIRDQIVVILPLESAPKVPSDSDQSTTSPIRELELRGYIAQPLVS